MGKGRETTVLFFRALSVAKQLRVDVVDQVHFVWPGANKLHMLQQPEESRFDRIAGPEDRNPPCSPGREFRGKRIDHADQRQRRRRNKLPHTIQRGDRWDNADLGSSSLQSAKEAVEIFR